MKFFSEIVYFHSYAVKTLTQYKDYNHLNHHVLLIGTMPTSLTDNYTSSFTGFSLLLITK